VFGADILAKIQSSYCSDEHFPKKMRVSSTALKNYYSCGVQWLCESILTIQESETDAKLMKDTVIGNMYHAVLREFFTALITTNDTILPAPQKNGNFSQTYLILKDSVDRVFNRLPKLQGVHDILSPLNVTLLRAGKNGILETILFFLDAFFDLFAGHSIAASEQTLYDASSCEHAYLKGVVDCILQTTSSMDTVIVDFKKNMLISRKASIGDELEDFQIPMYVQLAEANKYPPVTTALFMSILNREKQIIFGSVTSQTNNQRTPKNEKGIIERGSERGNKILAELIEKSEQFAQEMLSGQCSTVSEKESQCFECVYRELCRTTYVVAGMQPAQKGNEA